MWAYGYCVVSKAGISSSTRRDWTPEAPADPTTFCTLLFRSEPGPQSPVSKPVQHPDLDQVLVYKLNMGCTEYSQKFLVPPFFRKTRQKHRESPFLTVILMMPGITRFLKRHHYLHPHMNVQSGKGFKLLLSKYILNLPKWASTLC